MDYSQAITGERTVDVQSGKPLEFHWFADRSREVAEGFWGTRDKAGRERPRASQEEPLGVPFFGIGIRRNGRSFHLGWMVGRPSLGLDAMGHFGGGHDRGYVVHLSSPPAMLVSGSGLRVRCTERFLTP